MRRITYTHAHTNTAQRVQSSHNLKERFFQGNTNNLLEAGLSVIQHRRNTGHRCPFRLVRSCGTRDRGLASCLCFQEQMHRPVRPGSLQFNLFPGSRGQNLSQKLSSRSLVLQFPPSLFFPACFLWGPGPHPASFPAGLGSWSFSSSVPKRLLH